MRREEPLKISVVMPTYNTPVPFLQEATESILGQTLRDFEFIIVDDGSTNESAEYLLGLKDPRIRLIRNESNLGITRSLNIGFRAAQGKYVARMDSDDVSLPTRLEKQYAFMETHPDAIVCGARTVDYGKSPNVRKVPYESREDYRIRMLFANPGPAHATAFFDREKLVQHHLAYDEQLIYAQDYGMWASVVEYGEVVKLPEVLLYHRSHPDQISKAHRQKQIECDKLTQGRLLRALLGEVSKEEIDRHYLFSTGYYKNNRIDTTVLNWYRRLIEANDRKGIYDKKRFRRYVYRVIIPRAAAQSFGANMSYLQKTVCLFRALPFPLALQTVIGAGAKKLLHLAGGR